MEHLVEAEVLMDLLAPDDHARRIPVRLRYDGCDPLAVQLTFTLPGDTPVSWYVARDLLLAGAERPCGEGDVRVYPVGTGEHAAVAVHVRVCQDEAVFRCSAPALLAFLDRTGRIVEVGREHLHSCFERHLDDELGDIVRSHL